MQKRWYYIIVFTVIVIVIVSGFEIYKAFEEDKDVSEYKTYAVPISRDFDVDLLSKVGEMQKKVLVKSEDISPGN